MDDRGSIPSSRRDVFSSPPRPDRLWGASVTAGVKWLGREADHSPPSSAEVKNVRSYTSTPQYVFMVWYVEAYMAPECRQDFVLYWPQVQSDPSTFYSKEKVIRNCYTNTRVREGS